MLGVNPDNSEWYTPPYLLERVYSVMSIDLDPASPFPPVVRCKKYFTVEDDGLSKEWFGNVFLNPPYGREISKWISKLCDSWIYGYVRNAIVLVPVKSDTRWFDSLADISSYFVTLKGRVKYVHPKLGVCTAGTFPSCVFLVSFDDDIKRSFCESFYDLGLIWSR